MRMLIFSSFYVPDTGGYIQSLSEFVRRMVQKQVNVDIITCTSDDRLPKKELIDGATVYRVSALNPSWLNGSFPLPKLISLWRTLATVLKQHPDLISTQTRFMPLTWIGAFVALVNRIPLIHTERGGSHTKSDSKLIEWTGVMIDHTLGAIVLKIAGAATGVSAAACDFLRHLGCKHPHLIYNGIELSTWTSLPRRPIDPQHLTITFIGRLVFAKGCQDLLAVLPQLPPVQVNIVGDGPYRPILEASVPLSMKSRIMFLGDVPHEYIPGILAKTDVLVNPSYSEGLPRSVLEACAAGKTVIATDVGGTAEIIKTHGFLIAPRDRKALADAIRYCLDHPKEAASLGLAAQTYVRSAFDWEAICNQYLSIATSLLSSSASNESIAT